MSGAGTGGSLRESSAWGQLQAHFAKVRKHHLRDLFADDPQRGERLVADGAGLFLDFSKNRITDETLMLLGALARERGVEERREAMFRGEHINVSEDRAVLHVALRMPRGRSLIVDGTDVVKEVHEVLDRMGEFCERVRSGDWRGQTGKPIKAVVNIGIGGSDLGPVMAYEALKHYSDRSMTFRFGPQNVIGYAGELHPGVLAVLDAPAGIAALELFLDGLPAAKARPTKAKSKLDLSDFMPVSRDFAFIVDRTVAAGDIVKAARSADRALVSDVSVFDIYEGRGVAEGAKSVAIAVTLQPREKTLTDVEIDSVSARIVADVGKKTGAVLRG